MDGAAALREALEQGDFRRLRNLHSALAPHLPPPQSDEEAEATLHMTRTQAVWLKDRARCYSHAWLVERGLPSQLPDELKPKAERLYPRIVDAVFVSANTQSPLLKPVIKLVQDAMSDAVEEAYADGRKEPEFIRERMQDARAQTFKQLLGTTGEH